MARFWRGDPFIDAYVTSWLLCLKSATGLEATRHGGFTELRYVSLGGPLICRFIVKGNPYDLKPGETKSFSITGASGPQLAAADDPIGSFDVGTANGVAWHVTGVKGLTAGALLAMLRNGDLDAAYRDFVALFDSNDVLRGGRSADRFEPGGGNDRVLAGGGDDIVHKWRPAI